MLRRGRRPPGRLCAALLGLGIAASAASAQEAQPAALDEARVQELRRAFWALTDAVSGPEQTEPDAATQARIRLVPPLCREFLLDFPHSTHRVRVRWLLGRAWALARADAARATDALEGAVIELLGDGGVTEASLAARLAGLGVVTPRAEGNWEAATVDVDADGASDLVMTYRFAGVRAPLGGFCSLFRRRSGQWAAERLFGPGPALAAPMPDAPAAPRSYELRDLNGDGAQEILLHCRTVDRHHGLLLAFGVRQGRTQRLLWADCPDGEYYVSSRVQGWPQIIILRRFGSPEDDAEDFRRRERHHFGFDGRRYALVRTTRDAATYLYEQFWDGRAAYDGGQFERAAQLLERAASDDALRTRPREGKPGEPARPARYVTAEDERQSYRATARYFAGLAWAHVGEAAKSRQAMADVVAQYTYAKGVSARGSDFLPGLWAKRFTEHYRGATDLYTALAQTVPVYALWLYLADHPPEDAADAVLNSGVRTRQALVTDVTGDGDGDIIVALPPATGSGSAVIVFVRMEQGWRGYAIAGDAQVEAEQERGSPRGSITICGLSTPTDSRSAGAAEDWVVGQVADFDGDGVKDIEIKASRTLRVKWSGSQFGLVGRAAPRPEKSQPPPVDDEARQRAVASLDQIQDAIYDGGKFQPALMWLDTLEGRLRSWEEPSRARAFLAEVTFHRALCYAHLGQWERAARSYEAVSTRYPDLAWSAPAEARIKFLPPL